jgi:hypothetical protein
MMSSFVPFLVDTRMLKADSKLIVRAGFNYNGKNHLGFEVRVKPQGDVFVFVFERGHRRMHVSYHKSGRGNHNTDIPNAPSIPVKWDLWGTMEPMISYKTPVEQIRGRQIVAHTGWAIEDIEKAALPTFMPGPNDIVIKPITPTVGFTINIISHGTPPRAEGELHIPVLERFERGTFPMIEVETFDWLAPVAPRKRRVSSLHLITPNGEGWLLDGDTVFDTLEDAQKAVAAKYGVGHMSKRQDGGINISYTRIEDDPFDLCGRKLV